MKIRIGMKTPDAVDYAVSSALEEEYPKYDENDELVVLTEEQQWEKDDRKAEIESLCSKWFEYGECCVIEIDSETDTARVLTSKD